MQTEKPTAYFEHVKGEPRNARPSMRPRDPREAYARDQREHAEFILSTRETVLELVK
jgi:hypothetical protein